MHLTYRPRRLRRTNSLREMVRENNVSASDFIYPLFVHQGSDIQEIPAMPGSFRWSMDGLVDEVKRAWNLGIASSMSIVIVACGDPIIACTCTIALVIIKVDGL